MQYFSQVDIAYEVGYTDILQYQNDTWFRTTKCHPIALIG